jgi:ribosomal protein L24E
MTDSTAVPMACRRCAKPIAPYDGHMMVMRYRVGDSGVDHFCSGACVRAYMAPEQEPGAGRESPTNCGPVVELKKLREEVTRLRAGLCEALGAWERLDVEKRDWVRIDSLSVACGLGSADCASATNEGDRACGEVSGSSTSKPGTSAAGSGGSTSSAADSSSAAPNETARPDYSETIREVQSALDYWHDLDDRTRSLLCRVRFMLNAARREAK